MKKFISTLVILATIFIVGCEHTIDSTHNVCSNGCTVTFYQNGKVIRQYTNTTELYIYEKAHMYFFRYKLGKNGYMSLPMDSTVVE